MRLSQEQLAKFQQWAARKGIKNTCESCGSNKWELGDIVAAPTFAGGGFNIGGPTVPMVPMICTNCGYIRHYAAVLIGLAS